MSRRPGRPALDPSDPSTQVTLCLPSRRYDELYRRASAARVTVPELIRRTLDAELKPAKSDQTGRRP